MDYYYIVGLGVPLLAVGYWMYRVIVMDGATCKSKARLDGKTVVITGANTGIGKETAIDLARRGGRIILACRSKQRGEAALTEIRSKSGSENVVFRQLDLASSASIRNFAQRILNEERKINILINNAGIMMVPYQLTEDGFESQFGVNHLGHFLLTHLLLDRIKESTPSRIINVSSLGHIWGKLDFDDMMFSRGGYNKYQAYFRSKLANVMFTRELAKRLSGSNVTVCSVHPGAVNTELGRYLTGSLTFFLPFLYFLGWLFAKTPRQGAQTSIQCAVAKEVEGVTGKYWANCAVKKSSNLSTIDEDCIHLWEYSASQLGIDA